MRVFEKSLAADALIDAAPSRVFGVVLFITDTSTRFCGYQAPKKGTLKAAVPAPVEKKKVRDCSDYSFFDVFISVFIVLM